MRSNTLGILAEGRCPLHNWSPKTFMPPLPVLYVGDPEWTEFRDVFRWLGSQCELRSAASVDAAVEILKDTDFDPFLIVLAQSWPGQFRSSHIEQLTAAAPLARFSELLGSWCEGQTRTGHPLAGAMQFYWHQWIARVRPELERIASGDFSVWRLPLTATDEERLLALPTVEPHPNQGLLTIHTRNSELAGALCDAASMRGFSALWIRGRKLPQVAGIRAAICDSAAATNDAQEVAALRSQLGTTPIVVLTSFPRLGDRQRLLTAGAALVISKPFWLDDLFGQLREI